MKWPMFFESLETVNCKTAFSVLPWLLHEFFELKLIESELRWYDR
jgi:hypothetical protein